MIIKLSIVDSNEYRYFWYVIIDYLSLGSGMDRCIMEKKWRVWLCFLKNVRFMKCDIEWVENVWVLFEIELIIVNVCILKVR